MKAFPYTGAGTDGMDLRDYFAAKAMQSVLMLDPDAESSEDLIARAAYEMADAMMKAREQ